MPFNKPTNLPKWADLNPVDGVSGQPAILEPTAGKKDSGHVRLERPPRQDLNWLFNLIYNWLGFLSDWVADIGVKSNTTINNSGDLITAALKLYNEPGFINGFRLMDMPGGNKVQVGRGACFDNTNSKVLNTDIQTNPWLSVGLLKNIEASFSPGDDAGGLSSSLTLTDFTNYHVFVIQLPGGELDVGFDVDVEALNLIADHGVTNFRRIFTVHYINNGLKILRMKQYGDYFKYTSEVSLGIASLTGVGLSTSIVSVRVPDGITTIYDIKSHLRWVAGVQTSKYFTISGDEGALGPSSSQYDFAAEIQDSNLATPALSKRILMDGTNNQLNFVSEAPGPGAMIEAFFWALGYWDTRGRDWANGLGASDARGLFFG